MVIGYVDAGIVLSFEMSLALSKFSGMHRKSVEVAQKMMDPPQHLVTSSEDSLYGFEKSSCDNTNGENLRNHSIASLRAKAQEHSVKLLTEGGPSNCIDKNVQNNIEHIHNNKFSTK